MTITGSPRGFLYAHIDTGLPGARSMRVNSATTVTLTESYYQFPDLVGQLNTQLSSLGWAASWSSSSGKVTITKSSGTALTWNDRLPVILGFDRTPGETESATHSSLIQPRGAVHLLGATFEGIELKRELQIKTYRWRRSYGYAHFGAKLYRWRLTMHREGVEALEGGYCATGKITINMGDDAALSAANPDGALTGYVVAVESVTFLGPTQEFAEVSLVLAGSE